ncbi:nitric oxide reductase activation protein NorD [Noviherbaspirillum pedocola]|uniref:VWA domain-containing protein n=1 Tax=Noviherbaspirillum pedocola TaxID=2801341 RepID=A0A934T181_9BURK|nr:VWA domain-containing protein [Noviherbaspirillum pedocola]MBK4737042.1 VWA domain-containing protein [Noviherbaspirillum pedocola]
MPVDFDAAARRLSPYLRALWGREIRLHPLARPLQQTRPYLSEIGIHLPQTWHAASGEAAFMLYRAAAAHAAAHLAYSHQRFARGSLKPIQIVLLGLLEDARIEALAIAAMPGLRRLWLGCFPDAGDDESFAGLMLRLSRALLDPTHEDGHPWIAKARRLVAASQRHGSDALALREVASLLGNDIGQMRLQFNAKTYAVEPPYRDDHGFLWDDGEAPSETRFEDVALADVSTEGAPQQRMPGAGQEELAAKLVGADMEESAAPARATLYPEWDSRLGALRPRWCSVIERPAPGIDPALLQAGMAQYESMAARLAAQIRARRSREPVHLRRQLDGERFDIDALIDAAIAFRSGTMPDARVHQRTLHRRRSLAVLVLLDLSASTCERMEEGTVLDAIREAAVLLADAMERNGDRFAIHGFRSAGRHELSYLRFKDFDARFDDLAMSRLAAMGGEQSTRIGAALRHAGRLLNGVRSEEKLILVVTDGEPHDIDVFHPGYLVEDARHAVAEVRAGGNHAFCVTVDGAAGAYARRMFGEGQYLVVKSAMELPERLPRLYLRLAG